ncbi:superoxide dismutase family protein [Brevundimonas sp.]|uniref:superoxide dismutase family protein n=1 Tax=Brevundimonas sp. TaxID=1871086 RepID=UPI0035B2F87D
MRTLFALAAVSGLTLAACTADEAAAPAADPAATTPSPTAPTVARAPVGASATVPLRTAEGGDAGSVNIRQGSQGLVMTVEATGLTPGWHGIHLHQVGTCDGPAFESAGGHIHMGEDAPTHGLLNADADDSGDLPNIWAGQDGRAMAEIFTPFARLADAGPGVHLLDGDGSAIVIHANADDYQSQPIGGAGDRVACGVIAAG